MLGAHSATTLVSWASPRCTDSQCVPRGRSAAYHCRPMHQRVNLLHEAGSACCVGMRQSIMALTRSLSQDVVTQLRPQLVWQPSVAAEQVLEIHSGCDHVAARCASGDVLTWGSGKQGQLGRVGVRMSDRGHTMLETFTQPARMHLPFSLRSKCRSVACGWYSTYAVLHDGSVYACGLNNYGQLGVDAAMAVYAPKRVKALADKTVMHIAAGAHHTLALCNDGSTYAFGRPTYGRLGVTGIATNSDEPMREAKQLEIPDLEGTVQGIAAGDSVSGCFTDQMCGLFLCGSNNTGMLAKGDDDTDETQMARVKRTKAFNEVKVTQLSFGGQHVVMLTVPAEGASA